MLPVPGPAFLSGKVKGLNVVFFMVWSVQPAVFKHVCKAFVKSEYELYHVFLLAQNSRIHRTDFHKILFRIIVKICPFFFILIKIKQE